MAKKRDDEDLGNIPPEDDADLDAMLVQNILSDDVEQAIEDEPIQYSPDWDRPTGRPFREPRSEQRWPEWATGIVMLIGLIALLATMSGALRWGPTVAVAAILITSFMDEPEVTKGLLLGALIAMAAAVWFGSGQHEVGLQSIAYRAHRAEIGCENADLYTETNGQRHFQKGPPTDAEITRCINQDEAISPWSSFRFKLERKGWEHTR